MPCDLFFYLKKPTLAKIRELLIWANGKSLRTDVDMLNCSKSFSRVTADKSFSDVLTLMKRDCIGYFRIILRKEMNVFGLLSDKKDIRDLLEIGIRGVEDRGKEYFLFIYLHKDNLENLRKIVDLKKP